MDLNELYADLEAADSSGDTKLATHIAGLIKQQQPQQQAPQQAAPQQRSGALDYISKLWPVQALDAANTMATGAASSVVGGISGLASLPFVGADKAADITQNIQQRGTAPPRTEGGRNILKGAEWVMEPLNQVANLAGNATLNATGSPAAATMAHISPDILSSVLGLSAARGGPLSSRVLDTLDKGSDVIESAPTNIANALSSKKQATVARAEKGIYGADDIDFKVVDGKAVSNPKAKAAEKQGFERKFIADIGAASPATKGKLREMVSLKRAGEQSELFGIDNRPSSVVGDSMANRYNVVLDGNREAGKRIDEIAQTQLADADIDLTPAFDAFNNKLAKLRVKVDEDGALDFKGSTIQGSSGAESLLNKLNERITDMEGGKALDAHELKRFIDEQVSFGKLNSDKPLTSKTENIVKNLRFDINKMLHDKFKDYAEANIDYSDSIELIGEFQKANGASIDLTSPRGAEQMGIAARKIMSNQSSRTRMLESMEKLDDMAERFGTKFDDNLKHQALFVQKLDDMFGKEAQTSFGGEVERSMVGASEGIYATTDPAAAAVATGKLADKFLNRKNRVNPEGRFKALEGLLVDDLPGPVGLY